MTVGPNIVSAWRIRCCKTWGKQNVESIYNTDELSSATRARPCWALFEVLFLSKRDPTLPWICKLHLIDAEYVTQSLDRAQLEKASTRSMLIWDCEIDMERKGTPRFFYLPGEIVHPSVAPLAESLLTPLSFGNSENCPEKYLPPLTFCLFALDYRCFPGNIQPPHMCSPKYVHSKALDHSSNVLR